MLVFSVLFVGKLLLRCFQRLDAFLAACRVRGLIVRFGLSLLGFLLSCRDIFRSRWFDWIWIDLWRVWPGFSDFGAGWGTGAWRAPGQACWARGSGENLGNCRVCHWPDNN